MVALLHTSPRFAGPRSTAPTSISFTNADYNIAYRLRQRRSREKQCILNLSCFVEERITIGSEATVGSRLVNLAKNKLTLFGC